MCAFRRWRLQARRGTEANPDVSLPLDSFRPIEILQVAMPTLSFHAPEELSRRLRKKARAAKKPLSTYLVETIERGIVSEPPQTPYGSMKGLIKSESLDPNEPAFSPDDWKH